ncbi:MAG: disulfide bond formation protein B [Desulfobacterales bacterium]|nr:disulfide bond formation protein B [Desulfobacterales bacterium]
MSPSNSSESMDWALLFGAWILAAAAAMGSIFFSHVMDFAPCVLCWYQRICLFPLVVVLAVGLFPFDRGVVRYALPLAGIGWCIALYHNLLYAGVIPPALQPCTQGVSCTEKYIELFGVLSIPMLSLIGFSTLIIILIILKRRSHEI